MKVVHREIRHAVLRRFPYGVERPYSCAPQAVGAVYDRPGFFVQSL